MNALAWIIVSTFLVSLISLIGIFTLSLKKKLLNKIVLYLVALSAGALISAVFVHLLPEAVAEFSNSPIFDFVLVGFILFFLMEKVLHWRHCHDLECKVHTFAYVNLIGDAVHNFTDGLIIAAAFLVNVQLGLITLFAIALHEIPQEIGDFGVLIYAGFARRKALFYNFLVALTVVLGGVVGYFASSLFDFVLPFLIPFAAGGFLYISASDLIPEIRKEVSVKKSLLTFVVFLAGMLLMKLVVV